MDCYFFFNRGWYCYLPKINTLNFCVQLFLGGDNWQGANCSKYNPATFGCCPSWLDKAKRWNVERSLEEKGTNSLLSTSPSLNTSRIPIPPFPTSGIHRLPFRLFSCGRETACGAIRKTDASPSQADVGHAGSTDIYTFPPLHLTLLQKASP